MGEHDSAWPRIIDTGEAQFCVDRRGNGQPAVFLHGFGGSLSTWDAAWERIPAGRGLLRYDLRGFGDSTARSDAPFDHAGDLEALLDRLDIGRCDLVGVSMGGSIALNFALDYPARVSSLALISPGLTAWEWSEDWSALWHPIVTAARAGELPRAKALWLAHPLFASTLTSPGAEQIREEVSRFAGRQWIDDRQAPALPDLDRLPALAAPSLLLSGGRDFGDFRLIGDLIEATVADLRRHDRPDLGHLIHIEDPAWCCERLGAFWERTSAA